MAKGNPDDLDFNSHTSLMSWLGIKGTKEDVWNKWKYNPETQELKKDELQANDDSKLVQFELDEWFKGKDVSFLRNLYGRNSGNRNSGYWNSGEQEFGELEFGEWLQKLILYRSTILPFQYAMHERRTRQNLFT